MSEQSPPSRDGLSDAKQRLFALLMQERQAPKVLARQTIVTGDVAITPPQAHEFAIPNPDRHIFNLPLLLQVHLPLDAALLREIVRALVAHHDALRLCSAQDEHGWRQWIAPPPEEPPVAFVDLSALDETEQRAAIEAQVAALQLSFDLARGPLFKAALFDLGPARPARLLLLAHHIACDQYSAGILAEDFVTAYRQLRSGESLTLPAKTTAYLDWAQRLADYAHGEAARKQLAYWLNRGWSKIRHVHADFPDGINSGATAALVAQEIDTGELEQLSYQRLKAHGAQLPHVVVYALARTLARWTGGEAAMISMCQHGRIHPFPDLDVSRTVGWLSYQYPLV
ncbi:MAG TPA: condensation domain-containing protein, partial [Herpetosiphonaceae bacterium]